MSSYALLGEKLGHSLSPQLHAAIYKQLGVTDAQYRTAEVPAEGLEDFFAGFAAGAFDGINITIPYKAAAIPFLQQVDAKARALNAVNCVHRQMGQLKGYNTDCLGFAYSLRKNRVELEDAHCAVLGAGGSAQAVAAVLAEGRVSTVKIYNRSIDKANRLSLLIESLNPDVKTELVTPEQLSGVELDLLVNTTSLGMYPHVDDTPLPNADLSNVKTVVDLIYNPGKTLLLNDAESQGARAVNGLEMLVAQAVYSVEIWRGGNVITQLDMDALTQELAENFS